MKLIKNITNKFYRLSFIDQTAIAITLAILIIFLLVIWKQGIETLNLIGKSGSFMPYLHHSRWGALSAIIGGILVLKYPKGIIEIIGFFLMVIGIILVFQHLATEQCFALLTSTGRLAGALC